MVFLSTKFQYKLKQDSPVEHSWTSGTSVQAFLQGRFSFPISPIFHTHIFKFQSWPRISHKSAPCACLTGCQCNSLTYGRPSILLGTVCPQSSTHTGLAGASQEPSSHLSIFPFGCFSPFKDTQDPLQTSPLSDLLLLSPDHTSIRYRQK